MILSRREVVTGVSFDAISSFVSGDPCAADFIGCPPQPVCWHIVLYSGTLPYESATVPMMIESAYSLRSESQPSLRLLKVWYALTDHSCIHDDLQCVFIPTLEWLPHLLHGRSSGSTRLLGCLKRSTRLLSPSWCLTGSETCSAFPRLSFRC